MSPELPKSAVSFASRPGAAPRPAADETSEPLSQYRGPVILLVGIIVLVAAGLAYRSHQQNERSSAAWMELARIETATGADINSRETQKLGHPATDEDTVRIGRIVQDGVIDAYRKLLADYAGTDVVPAIQMKLGYYGLKSGRLDEAEKAFQTLVDSRPETIYPSQGQTGLTAVRNARLWESSPEARLITDSRKKIEEEKKQQAEQAKKAEEERAKKAAEEQKKLNEEKAAKEKQDGANVPPPATPPAQTPPPPATPPPEK